jgi:hypothetical protein
MGDLPIVEELKNWERTRSVPKLMKESSDLITELVAALEEIDRLEHGDGSFEADAINAYRIARAVLARARSKGGE